MRTSAVLLLLASWTAAAPAPGPGEDATMVGLEDRIKALKRAPGCGDLIAMEWLPSFPVPFRDKGAEAYKVLFFPVARAEGKTPAVLPPAVEAVLPASGAPRCRALAGGEEELGPAETAAARGLDFSAFAGGRRKLLVLIERVAALYFAAGRGRESDRLAKEFADQFAVFHQPGLKAHYRKLNPDFWDWIKARSGRTL